MATRSQILPLINPRTCPADESVILRVSRPQGARLANEKAFRYTRAMFSLANLPNPRPLALPICIQVTYGDFSPLNIGCVGICTCVIHQPPQFDHTECIHATVIQTKTDAQIETLTYVVPFAYVTQIGSSEMLPRLPVTDLRKRLLFFPDKTPPIHRWHRDKILLALTDLGMHSDAKKN
jgi:hypothetical protein